MKLLRATRDESYTIYIRNSHNTKNNASGIHSRPCTANVLSKMRKIFWKLMVKLHSTSHRATMACVLLTLRGNDLQNLSCQASSYVLVPKHTVTATGVVQVWRSVTVHFKATKGAHKAVSMDAAIASALSEQEHLLPKHWNNFLDEWPYCSPLSFGKSLIYEVALLVVALHYCWSNWLKLACDGQW